MFRYATAKKAAEKQAQAAAQKKTQQQAQACLAATACLARLLAGHRACDRAVPTALLSLPPSELG